MRSIARFFVLLLTIAALLSSALPCGPGYTTPLFDTAMAPETPYADYAAGRLGIIKPTFRRSVLYAAYRYIAGSGLGTAEQQAIADVWRAEINNKDFNDNSIDDAVTTWIERRKDVVGKEEKTPDIYAERSYGGYDFFPNCTRNAFETAAETLVMRTTAHGPGDASVANWVRAQDQVFQNCSSGKQTPEPAPPGAPDWLQKDRAYQLAAASFYSLDYTDAKRRFADIAQDADSPWAETADYLVARTLIRQASLSKTPEKAAPFYDEAETHLQRFISRSGKFSASAERLDGLIKYRRHPRERVSELARKLTQQGGNENFRQDVIDYNWLLDKFENEALSAEEKRKAAEKEKAANAAVNTNTATNRYANAANSNASAGPLKKNDDDMELRLYTNATSYRFYVRPDTSDDEAIAEAEKIVGQPLNDTQKTQVKSLRQSAYSARFTENRQSHYEGGYWGDEKLTPSLMPDFLRQDDVTDWLYTYQIPGAEAYLYSVKKFRESPGSELWLMTALSKADQTSADITRLLEAAKNTSRTTPGFTTIAYHRARILLLQGKSAEARKLIDEMLGSGDELPLSARNSFLSLRLKLAETLEDFLKYSLKKPFGFDFDGSIGTINEIIAEQKTFYDPEYHKEGREAYDAEVEERYKDERLWQDRAMFAPDTIDLFNRMFPQTALLEVQRSPALPEHMRERFVVAIWTRAFLLDDMATMLTISPVLIRYHPEFEPLLSRVIAARTQAAQDNAALYFVLKNPILSPYIEEGMGKADNEQEQWDSDDWWCEPYDSEYSDETNSEVPKGLPPRPSFLSLKQTQTAEYERKRLKDIGDAPEYLSGKVLAWAKRNPADRRVPEALYIMIEATGWTKYGCGNNEELRDEMTEYLRKHYPNSAWTAKLAAEDAEK